MSANPWQRPPRGPVWQRQLALVLPAVVLGSCAGLDTKEGDSADSGPLPDSGYVAPGTDTGYTAPGTPPVRDSDSGYTVTGTVTRLDSDSGYHYTGTAATVDSDSASAESADTGAPGGSAAPAPPPIGALPKPR